MVRFVLFIALLGSVVSPISADFETYNNYTIVADTVEGRKIISQLTRGSGCPDEFLRYRKSCYYFHLLRSTWSEAKQLCNELGAERVIVETADEDMFIIKHLYELVPLFEKVNAGLNHAGLYWTDGINRNRGKRDFRWDTTGTPIKYERWVSFDAYPKNYKNQGNVAIVYYHHPPRKNDKFGWIDFHVNNRYGVICEKSVEV